MKQNNSQFFQNRDCEYFPCHEAADAESFNCLFCYCPLYLLGTECGGNYTYLDNGVKSCQLCTLPHQEGGYAHIMEKYALIRRKLDGQRETDK